MSMMDTILPMDVAEQLAALMEVPDSLMYSVADTVYSVVGPVADRLEHLAFQHAPELHQWLDALCKAHEHPFASSLPFLNPWHVVFAVITYFVSIVFFTGVGKFFGKCNCKPLGMLHNLLLYFLSLYMCVGLLVSARAAGYTLWNNAAGSSKQEWRVAKFIWVFYISKVPEWFDTILMVLKHNYRQVSYLHVYHHVTIFVIWWIACITAPGGEAYYSAMVNSGVHVIMYGYYFLTMLFPSGPVRQVLNRFKFVVTKGQMMQFAINCLQSIYDLVIVPRDELKYSPRLLQLLFWYMSTLLVLFANFLRKNKPGPKAGRSSPPSKSGAKE